jgi:hypothetical protein
MSGVMHKLAGAVLAIGALGAGAEAAPFRIVSDGPGSVWVLDAGSGALDWCRTRAPSGPKVIDVFGAEAVAREAVPRRSEPVCSTAPGTLSAEARTLAAAGAAMRGATAGYLWRAGYGSAISWGGYGGGYGGGYDGFGGGAVAAGVFGGIGSVEGFINILGSDDIDIKVE